MSDHLDSAEFQYFPCGSDEVTEYDMNSGFTSALNTFPSCQELGIDSIQGYAHDVSPQQTFEFEDTSCRTQGISERNKTSCFRDEKHEIITFSRGLDPNSAANPFSPRARIPLPPACVSTSGFEFEPTFILRRNERERDRVRCVNDMYSILKERLPLQNKDKRVSKVETLRCAIKYIRHLQSIVTGTESENDVKVPRVKRPQRKRRKQS